MLGRMGATHTPFLGRDCEANESCLETAMPDHTLEHSDEKDLGYTAAEKAMQPSASIFLLLESALCKAEHAPVTYYSFLKWHKFQAN